MRIETLTCAIGAQLHDINLGDAVHDEALFQEIYAALLQHKVLFLRDQTLDKLSRLDHMAFAKKLGELETHPMVPSHPEAPGLVQIYKSPDSPIDRYENSWHTDGTFRPAPALGCVLRCIECPPVGETPFGPTWCWPMKNCLNTSKTRFKASKPITASTPPLQRRCPKKNASR